MRMSKIRLLSLGLVFAAVFLITPFPAVYSAYYWYTEAQIQCNGVAYGYRGAVRVDVSSRGQFIGGITLYCFESYSDHYYIRTYSKPDAWRMKVDIINLSIGKIVCTQSGSGDFKGSPGGSVTVTCAYGSVTGSVQKPATGV